MPDGVRLLRRSMRRRSRRGRNLRGDTALGGEFRVMGST